MSGLPQVTGRQLLAALRRAGFELDHVTGSHHVLIGSGRRRVVIPVHAGKDVPAGTLHNILRQAGLSVEAFIGLL